MAFPPTTAAGRPGTATPSTAKLTVPCAVPESAVTVAVHTTCWPRTAGFGAHVTAVLVATTGVAVITEHEDICNARLTWNLPTGQCVANVSTSRLALKTERITRISGENAYIKIDYAAKNGTMIRRIANEIQMSEVRDQLRRGSDLTSLKWQDLVNIEPLVVDDAEPIVAEIREFLDAVRTGRRPAIDAEAGFANVRTAQRILDAIRRTMATYKA